jgi:hypothetical protein
VNGALQPQICGFLKFSFHVEITLMLSPRKAHHLKTELISHERFLKMFCLSRDRPILTRTPLQARRISRLAVFANAGTPIGLLPALVACASLSIFGLSIGLVVGFLVAWALLLAVQTFFRTKVVGFATSVRPRLAGEVWKLLLFFLLFAVALLQLYMSPVISGNADSDISWDKYHVSLEVVQGIAGILSAVSALIAIIFSFVPFARNSDDLSVRLVCATITLCPYQQPTCHCTEQVAFWRSHIRARLQH